PYYDASDGYQYTAPVTLFPEGSTPQQVQNLAGNVWEWCLDWHGDYSLGDTFDPHGPAGGTEKVIRGGSWNGSVNYCRAFHRNKSDPNLRYKDGGIRLVRSF
ncbi:MAG: SUMF1/EgtB/PvdO family nonheme iron enzyme, partial [Candidatus Glassbacteria bacterium]